MSRSLARQIGCWINEGDEIEVKLRVEGLQALIRLSRPRWKLSLRAVARRIGCSATYLSMIRSGKCTISPLAFVKLIELEMEQW